MAEKQPSTDDLIRYLGYEVHPGKIEEFWKSEDEKKQYLQRIKGSGGQLSALDRDAAILNVKLMTGIDKVIGFIGSILLMISFFLPVYSFTMFPDSGAAKHVSGSAISYFINMPLIGGYAAWGGGVMIWAVLFFGVILIACPVVGVLNILGLVSRRTGEGYFHAIREYSQYAFILLFLYILLALVLLFGTPHPFGSLGVFGESFNLSAIFRLTGIGFWFGIAGLAIVLAERRGL
ncbi:MAG: hypothetical protein A2W25_01520 [candidate division Zixibacteria bacterium RBG_16_53_22]|nr:MAG: hypothetical protein A2W25_01520 [candidate division Zixibacteria bacterium RBG_16_53_22]